MKTIFLKLVTAFLLSAPPLLSNLLADAPGAANPDVGAPKPLVEIASPGSESRFVPDDQSNNQVTVSRSADSTAVVLTIAPGTAKYPGVWIKPKNEKLWDLSAYGHVEARITNLGTHDVTVGLRLDDDSDGRQTYNAALLPLKPGETGICKAIFGYCWGNPGASIRPADVSLITLFAANTTTSPLSLRIESLQAGGPPGEKIAVDPSTLAIKPPGGMILGPGATFDASKQISAKGGAKVSPASDNKSIDVAFSGSANDDVIIKPVSGMWNLNEQLEVRVKLKNTGSSPVTPQIRLDSRGGNSDTIAASAPIVPGSVGEIVVAFAPRVPWKGVVDPDQQVLEVKKTWGGEPGTGTSYTSNKTTGIHLLPGITDGASNLQVTSISADLPQAEIPAWLGQKPPVDGDWTKTFDDEFDGTAINLTKWNIYTRGAWHLGAKTHYTKDNVIVKDGMLTLRIEKKPGYHDDNPAMDSSDYATGYADTFGKWSQRYGYFEARMKLSKAASIWPGFWLMPDRGLAAGDDHVRYSTKSDGMEFDIMEELSSWGPYRHDFGMHWDDYNKYHKSIGDFSVYATPDKDGFITVGMLWTPGSAIFYDNGKESGRWESPRIASVPEYIILDHITGGWESEPLDDKQLPADFVIDYVRVWQRKDLASAVDGPKPNDGGPLPPDK